MMSLVKKGPLLWPNDNLNARPWWAGNVGDWYWIGFRFYLD